MFVGGGGGIVDNGGFTPAPKRTQRREQTTKEILPGEKEEVGTSTATALIDFFSFSFLPVLPLVRIRPERGPSTKRNTDTHLTVYGSADCLYSLLVTASK